MMNQTIEFRDVAILKVYDILDLLIYSFIFSDLLVECDEKNANYVTFTRQILR